MASTITTVAIIIMAITTNITAMPMMVTTANRLMQWGNMRNRIGAAMQ